MAKYRGKLSVTMELIKTLLKLPDEVEIVDVEYNEEREIITFKLVSIGNKIESLTFLTAEGNFIPSSTWEMPKEDSDNA